MDKTKTVCFSGYRPGKFTFNLLDGQEACLNLQAQIKAEIIRAADGGFTTFLCGMAMGFDLLCGRSLLQLKEESQQYSFLELVAVPPFHGHSFADPWGSLHKQIMAKAADIIYPSEKRNSHAYHIRNRYLVDNSSRLICYFDGQPGGTAFTVAYAQKIGLEIINLHQC